MKALKPEDPEETCSKTKRTTWLLYPETLYAIDGRPSWSMFWGQ